MMLSLVSAVRFFSLALIPLPSPEYDIIVGSVQHTLGSLGKVMNLVMGFFSLESFIIRGVFIVQEDSGNMFYMAVYMTNTLVNDPNSGRTKKFLQTKFFEGKKTLIKLLSLVVSWHLMTCFIRISDEVSDQVSNQHPLQRSLFWILWTFFNIGISFVAVVDYISVPMLRSINGGSQATRQITLLEEATTLVFGKAHSSWQTEELVQTQYHSFIEKYCELKSYMSASTKVYGMFVFPHNFCSTFINGSLIFGVIHVSNNWFLLPIIASLAYLCVNQIWIIMTKTAKVTETSLKIYRVLCSLPNRRSNTYLTLKQRRVMQEITKCLGGDRAPIAVKGVEGRIYNSEAVFENISSTISLVIQFLELTRDIRTQE